MPDVYSCPDMELDCPFCHKGKIKVRYVAPTRVTRQCRGSGRTQAHTYFTREKYIIISGCPICGKTKEEVDRKVNKMENESVPSKEASKRAQESGLPTRF